MLIAEKKFGWLLTSFFVIGGCGDAGAPPATTELETTGTTSEALTPAPSDVYIAGPIVGAGTGCPGPLASTIAPDRKSFIVAFSDMDLSYPPPPKLKQKYCTVSMNIHVPQGWQFSIATINTRGYAELSWNVTARQTSSYFFGGNPLGAVAHSTLVGPTLVDPYTFTDYVGFTSLVWSPCGTSRPFAINSRIVLDARYGGPNASGLFSNDSIDGIFRKIIGWEWRPCRM